MGQLVDKLVENNILLIFAVTDNQRQNYEVRKESGIFSLMFIHFRPQWGKQKGMCFSVFVEPERTWRKIYRCVNRLHESLVYSVLFTTCSNTVFITSPRPTSHDTNILCFLSSPFLSSSLPFSISLSHISNSVAALQEFAVDV